MAYKNKQLQQERKQKMMGFKEIEDREVELLSQLQKSIVKVEDLLEKAESDTEVDQEKLTIAKNHLEKGFSGAVKCSV